MSASMGAGVGAGKCRGVVRKPQLFKKIVQKWSRTADMARRITVSQLGGKATWGFTANFREITASAALRRAITQLLDHFWQFPMQKPRAEDLPRNNEGPPAQESPEKDPLQRILWAGLHAFQAQDALGTVFAMARIVEYVDLHRAGLPAFSA